MNFPQQRPSRYPFFEQKTSIVLILAFIGLLMRLYGLGDRGFWQDEIHLYRSALTGYQWSHDAPLAAWLHLLFMALVKNTNSFSFHFPAAFFGALTILVAYAIGKQVRNHRTGLIAAWLTMLSPMALFLSQEGRPYGLFQLTSSLVCLCFIKAYKSGELKWWMGYGITLFLSCLTQLITIQLIFAFGCFLVARVLFSFFRKEIGRNNKRELLLFGSSTFLAGTSGLLWIWQRDASHMLGVVNGMYQNGVVSFIRIALSGLGPVMNYAKAGPVAYTDLLAIIFFLFFVIGIRRFWKRNDGVTILLFVIGLSLLLTYCSVGDRSDWGWLRYVTHLVVPYLVIVAIGIEGLISKMVPIIRGPILSIILFLLFYPGLVWWSSDARYSRGREYFHWAKNVERNAHKLKGVIFNGNQPRLVPHRMITLYDVFKKDDLPEYLLYRDRVINIKSMPSLFHLTTIPIFGQDRLVPLLPGVYAFISPKGIKSGACEGLTARSNIINTASSITAFPVKSGVRFCRINQG